MKISRMLLVQAALFGAISLCAYAQQENDPTWYDPWAKAATTAEHAKQPVAHHPHKALAVSQDHAATQKESKTRQPRKPERVALVTR